MKTGAAGVVLGLAIACGAGLAIYMRGGPAAPPAVAAAPGGADAARVAVLEEDLAAANRSIGRLEQTLAQVQEGLATLRAENAKLRGSVTELAAGVRANAALVAGASTSAALAGAPASAPLAAPAVAAPGGLGDTGGVYFSAADAQREAEIKSVLAKMKSDEQAAAREREREERMADARRRIADLTPRLGLSVEQSDTLANVMIERDEALAQLARDLRDGKLPRDKMGDKRSEAREAYEAKVQAALSPAQYAELQKVREEQGGGRDNRGMGMTNPGGNGGGGNGGNGRRGRGAQGTGSTPGAQGATPTGAPPQ